MRLEEPRRSNRSGLFRGLYRRNASYSRQIERVLPGAFPYTGRLSVWFLPTHKIFRRFTGLTDQFELPVRMYAVEALKPYERNARKHPKRQIEALKSAISRFGFNAPVAVWQDGMLLAGHGRVEAAKELGLAEVPGVDLAHLPLTEARAYMLADNRIADMAKWDDDLLKGELAELHLGGIDVDGLGWNDNELAKLVADIDVPLELKLAAGPSAAAPGGEAGEPAGDADSGDGSQESPGGEDPLIGPTVVEAGEVWFLGDHRLVCGDSTDPAVIARVAGEETVDLLLTDPPYGVSYSDKQKGINKALGQEGNDAEIANDELTGGDLRSFIADAFSAAMPALKPGACFYAFSAPGSDGQLGVMMGMADAGLMPRHGLAWVKKKIVLSRADVNYQHEAIHYGWKPGAAHKWYGPTNETSVWECDSPRKCGAHPTMKPPELLERAVRNSSQAGDLVLDIFGGSGSTMVAAHRRGRRAALVELNEQFASVICRRAIHELGLSAVREDGLTFEEKEAALAADAAA